MFRRLESGLPKEPVFPANLQELGYFINDEDEIRNIQNPKAYFLYFLSKNERINDLQREGMNEAIRNIVLQRLENLGLEKIRLPFGSKATDRHVPILVSSNIKSKKRVCILFYEHHQDLGILSYRTICGKGGINKGSAVNLVKYLLSLSSSNETDHSPGIILANLGQLRWWRRGKKAITQMSWHAIPSKSLVESAYEFDSELNTIPENKDITQHVEYIFNKVVTQMTAADAKLDIIGVSAGAVEISVFLEKQENWEKWKSRVSAFAAIATYYDYGEIENEEFKVWLKNRGRVYITSDEPCGTFLVGPDGSNYSPSFGCPAFSLGQPYYPETLLPNGYKTIIDWFEEVAADPDYVNPEFISPKLQYEGVEENEETVESEEIGEIGETGETGETGKTEETRPIITFEPNIER